MVMRHPWLSAFTFNSLLSQERWRHIAFSYIWLAGRHCSAWQMAAYIDGADIY